MGENVQRPTSNAQLSTSGVAAALAIATGELLAELGPDGHWIGELSSSALSTATAAVALAALGFPEDEELIAGGLRWLEAHQNSDGGWGDTIRSLSNISTTALCWSAFGAALADERHADCVSRAERWLAAASGSASVSPEALADAIEHRYGKDRTFSVPILMTLAISGRLGPGGWRRVMPLPFELAALPHQVFGAVRLPVVSYALPALIAIGQAIHHHAPSRWLPLRWLRGALRPRTLRVLASTQPENGGFLEATPLTSFVTMSLASMGLKDHRVAKQGAAFLRASARLDGSWPIDTNLATWVSTLAIKALSAQPAWGSPEMRVTLREWLCGQQYQVEHPYTHAAPYGWAWTDLPGGVPDADDTAGALLALLHLGPPDLDALRAGRRGVRWLLGLQNRDGGVPTFCRGWGALPFDRSSPDLTAHALRAWSGWLPHLAPEEAVLASRVESAIDRATKYLQRTQRTDGSWLPLWFGNEHAADDENPTYGTAQVVIALRDLRERGFAVRETDWRDGIAWLAGAQNADGGWGGVKGAPSSTEETSLAVDALAGSAEVAAVDAGAAWLVDRVRAGSWREPAAIGFYFAKLWYFERLYPMIFLVGALGRVRSGGVVSD